MFGIPNLDNLDAATDALCVFSKIQQGPDSELHVALLIKKGIAELRARLQAMVGKGAPAIFGPRNQNCALFLATDGKIYPHNKSKETPELEKELLNHLGPGVEPDNIFWGVYGSDIDASQGAIKKLQQLASATKLTRVSVPKLKSTLPPGTNLIYFGPPGTGKSYLADKETAPNHSERSLFHPEYTYHDFVGVYRPVVGEDPASKITGFDGNNRARPVCYFEFVPGPLVIALERAFKSPEERVFLIIDEINRGDCAAIFGDIFQLLDRNPDGSSTYGISIKHELQTYFLKHHVPWDIRKDGKLYFPGNFSILATMNTSDQSLYPMDSAFKRRWQWKSCNLGFGEVKTFLKGRDPVLDDGKERWNWTRIVENLNEIIARERLEDKQIGPWFIAPAEDTGLIERGAFADKCLFYLWHDVFKDEQATDSSPFKSSITTFQNLQRIFDLEGLKGIFKENVLASASATPAPRSVQSGQSAQPVQSAKLAKSNESVISFEPKEIGGIGESPTRGKEGVL